MTIITNFGPVQQRKPKTAVGPVLKTLIRSLGLVVFQ